MTMKRLLGLGVLILSFSLPARAQFGGSINGMGSIGGMGSINGMGGLSHVNFPDLPSQPEPRYQNSSAHGSEAEFVPSTYVPYEQALAQGQAALAPESKPKSVAQVAAEYRSAKRAAAKLAVVQDAQGRIAKQLQ